MQQRATVDIFLTSNVRDAPSSVPTRTLSASAPPSPYMYLGTIGLGGLILGVHTMLVVLMVAAVVLVVLIAPVVVVVAAVVLVGLW